MSTYSAGSASVQIVPDFTNAQRRIGEWFAGQRDMKVKVNPDLDNLGLARMRAEIAAQHPDIKVGIDKKHLATQMVQAVDFLTGTSTVGKSLMKLFDIKGILMTNLGGAGVAIGAALGQAMTNGIGGVAAMLPALVAGLAIPLATVFLGKAGFAGFQKQIESLTPAFKALQSAVSTSLWAGLAKSVTDLGNNALPMLRKELPGVAAEINGMGKALIGAINNKGNLGDFATTIDNVKLALHGITAAVAPLWSVFQNLATVGSGFLPGLTKSFGDLAQKFADFIQKARDSGALHDFIATSMTGLKQVLAVVIDLGNVLRNIFSAALPSGQVLMQVLKTVTDNLSAFSNSAAAHTGLTEYFQGLTKAVTTLMPGLMSLVQAMVTSVLPAMAGLAAAVAPIANTLLGQFADMLRELGPLFYPALAGALSTALGALSPLVAVFADLAKTVLPAVIDAIKRVAPLFAELADGVGELLVKAISTLAPLLPKIVAAFENIAKVIVPFTLGVVHLAVDILPPLVWVLGKLVDLLGALAPLLPVVLAAFLAYKAIGGISSLIGGFSDKLLAAAVNMEGLAKKGGALSGVAGRASNGLLGMAGGAEGLGLAAGGAAIGVGLVVGAIALIASEASKSKAAITDLAVKLATLKLNATFTGTGGADAARQLQDFQDKMTALRKKADTTDPTNRVSVNKSGVMATSSSADARGELEKDRKALSEVGKEYDKLRAKLGPLGIAQAQAALAQEDYNKALAHGTPQDVAVALGHLSTAQSIVRAETDKANKSARSQLDLMKEQQDAILGAANSQLAYENSVAQTASSLDAYRKQQKSGIDDQGAAERQLRGDILAEADANGKKAEADNAGKTATEIHKAAIDAQIATLQKYSAELTGPAKAAMDQMIASLQATNSSANIVKEAMDEVGVSVKSIPNDHQVIINAPTADQEKRLHDLGYTVQHLPDGTVLVTTDVQAAKNEVASFVADMSKKHITVTVDTVTGNIRTVGGKGGGGGSTAFGAIGGIVKPMADGGVNSLFMSGRIASVVKPNTWRIIGDRVQDDEAFIPINGDRRSHETLDYAASAMGYALMPKGNVLPPGMGSLPNSFASANPAGTAAVDAQSTASIAGFVNHGTVVTTDLDELARKSRRGTQRALVAAGL